MHGKTYLWIYNQLDEDECIKMYISVRPKAFSFSFKSGLVNLTPVWEVSPALTTVAVTLRRSVATCRSVCSHAAAL